MKIPLRDPRMDPRDVLSRLHRLPCLLDSPPSRPYNKAMHLVPAERHILLTYGHPSVLSPRSSSRYRTSPRHRRASNLAISLRLSRWRLWNRKILDSPSLTRVCSAHQIHCQAINTLLHTTKPSRLTQSTTRSPLRHLQFLPSGGVDAPEAFGRIGVGRRGPGVSRGLGSGGARRLSPPSPGAAEGTRPGATGFPAVRGDSEVFSLPSQVSSDMGSDEGDYESLLGSEMSNWMSDVADAAVVEGAAARR